MHLIDSYTTVCDAKSFLCLAACLYDSPFTALFDYRSLSLSTLLSLSHCVSLCLDRCYVHHYSMGFSFPLPIFQDDELSNEHLIIKIEEHFSSIPKELQENATTKIAK